MAAEVEPILKDRIETLERELQQERTLRETEHNHVAMVLHEFNTTLAVIRASTFIVRTYYDRLCESTILEHLKVIDSQSAHLGSLTGHLRNGAHPYRLGNLAIQSITHLKVLAESCRQQLVMLDSHAARISITCSDDLHQLNINGDELQSILTNLLSNALKYSAAETPVYLDIRSNRENLLITVCDKGVGIPPEELDSVFDPFYRARNVVSFTGSGLGLAIIKHSVERLGGNLSVESEINRGTTFTINLPYGI